MTQRIIEFDAPGGQDLKRVSPLQIFATGTVIFLMAHFTFSDTWAGYTECFAVWYNGRTKKETPIDESGVIVIPREVLEQPGTLKVNLCFNHTDSNGLTARLTSRPVEVLQLVKANY